jgi:CRISPR-associated protein Cmr6
MAIQSRRSDLRDVQVKKTTNARLWMDKYLDRTENEPNQALVQQVAGLDSADSYEAFYMRWKKGLESRGAVQREAHTLGRLVVDLGADSVLETHIPLQYTYGVPYIPGSALKGLAAHFADRHLEAHWKKGEDAHKIMFGTTDAAGYVTFFDALFVPDSGKQGKMLWKDVITVHHKEYYQSGDQPPADWDGTTIIPFLTTSGSFLIALAGPEGWVEKAFEILALALEKEGIGAKTSSGYGRMSFEKQSEREKNQRPAASKDTYEIDKRRLLGENPPRGKIRGVVKTVLHGGAFGFVIPQGGGKDHFIHSSEMPNGTVLKEGQVLQYTKVNTPKGLQAQDVEVLLEK